MSAHSFIRLPRACPGCGSHRFEIPAAPQAHSPVVCPWCRKRVARWRDVVTARGGHRRMDGLADVLAAMLGRPPLAQDRSRPGSA